ncbi:MAG TPA: methyltransferase domain-containing protein [Candidatus Binatia bacterium]
MSAGASGRRKLSAERPGRGAEFVYDEARHLAAYRHARTLVQGRDVLDAGCGEGFGTVLLAEGARSVLGIDYAAEPVATATAAYGRPGLEFRQLDVHDVARLGRRFDLVTNFQVIEHLPDPVRFLRAIREVVAPTGQLMLTTPNRLTSVSENPVHLREYTADELLELLQPIFGEVRMCSMLGNERVRAFDAERGRQVQRLLRLDPLGLRHLLPERLVYFAFANLAAVVRRRVVSAVHEAARIVPDDFTVAEASRPDALDLVAFCRP